MLLPVKQTVLVVRMHHVHATPADECFRKATCGYCVQKKPRLHDHVIKIQSVTCNDFLTFCCFRTMTAFKNCDTSMGVGAMTAHKTLV